MRWIEGGARTGIAVEILIVLKEERFGSQGWLGGVMVGVVLKMLVAFV